MTEHQPIFHETGRGPTGDIVGWIECSCKWRVPGMPSRINDQFQRFLDHAATEIAQLQRQAVDYRDVVRHAMQIFNTIRPDESSSLATNIVEWKIKAKDVLDYEPKANPPAPIDLTWADVFDADKEHFANIDYGAQMALACGFRYMCWNDRIYTVSDKGWCDGGRLREDVAEVARPKPRVPKVGDVVLWRDPEAAYHTYPAMVTDLYAHTLKLTLRVFDFKMTIASSYSQGTGPGQWSFREDA